MNIAVSFPKPTISAEAAHLVAILRDCGIDSVWQAPETQLLSFYLRNGPETANDIVSEIGHCAYAFFTQQALFWLQYQKSGPHPSIAYWFLQHANGALLKQALQLSARANLNTPAASVIYDRGHPEFEKDHAEFGKLATLCMLEDFPYSIYYNHESLIERLNYYEYFQQQYGDAPILKAFRRSLMRKEVDNLASEKFVACRVEGHFNPKSLCKQKYVSMMSYDRLRFARHYRFMRDGNGIERSVLSSQ